MASRPMQGLLRPAPRTRIIAPPRTPACWTQRTVTNTSTPRAAQPQPQPKEDPDYDEERERTANEIDALFGISPKPQPKRYDPSKTSETINNIFYSGNNPSQTPTSADELGAARRSHVFGENFSPRRTNFAPTQRKPLDFDNMKMPEPAPGTPSLYQVPAQQEIPESEINWPRLNATYGRSVELDQAKGRDIVRGIGMLGSLIARNKVRRDFQKQRFHERPGLKRKRLKSERWRARFKVGFRDVTARVSELTRKGW
ncbi:hypothetical protein BDV96DRAFT_124364 [Lophiotrema nucula]|uniref:Uncharacterized protein n=1 Tax=Lophiotrema nucula TaxID=690887 RepID=A0A6A5Z2X8_9PLEO|nr:hypothetical protein BDV96DRAFT_124364 [Lophiotrema nucula]